MTTTPQQHFEEFMERFSRSSNNELIDAFNNEVGNHGWGSARASYLAALHRTFDIRNLDYSEIGDEQGLCFLTKVYLKDKKLVKNLLE